MVYSKGDYSYEYTIKDFLKRKHCGACTVNGLRDYLFSIGVRSFGDIFFHVETQYENVSEEDGDFDPEYPYRLKSMRIILSDDEEYYSWEWIKLIDPEVRSGLIDYFEGKGYPIGAFIQENGSDDAQKIDQFFQAMIRDKFKPYRYLKYVEPNT